MAFITNAHSAAFETGTCFGISKGTRVDQGRIQQPANVCHGEWVLGHAKSARHGEN
jgi:hypothetical protein